MSVYIRRVKNKEGRVAEYYCIDYVVNGSRKYETVGKKGLITKHQARELLAERKRMIRLGQLGLMKVKVPTLNEFIPEYMDYIRKVRGNSSWKKSEYSLRLFAKYYGERKISEITPFEVDDFKRIRLGEGIGPATVNLELARVRSLFIFALKRKRYFSLRNPVSEAGMIPNVDNRRERVLSPEEEQRLLDCCPDFLKSLVIAALHTGMRKNELRLLRWEDIDLANNIITVQQTNSKNKKQRKIPINKVLRKTLLEKKLQNNGSYVFEKFVGKTSELINHFFKYACRKAGIRGLRFHDLRHTAATRMVDGGVNIVKVSRILGHSTLEMTMRYSHPEDSLREAVEVLSNFNSNVDKNVDTKHISDS